MILLEAMHEGVPVVTTRVGGVPNVVTEQEAILVPSEDPEFTSERWLDAYEDLYRTVIALSRGLD